MKRDDALWFENTRAISIGIGFLFTKHQHWAEAFEREKKTFLYSREKYYASTNSLMPLTKKKRTKLLSHFIGVLENTRFWIIQMLKVYQPTADTRNEMLHFARLSVEKIIDYLELDPGRYDDRPEGQGVRADRCDHDGRNWRMNHAGTSGYRVGGRTGRRAHDQSVTLDARHVLAVDEKIDVWQVRRWSSIYHDLV